MIKLVVNRMEWGFVAAWALGGLLSEAITALRSVREDGAILAEADRARSDRAPAVQAPQAPA